MIKVVPPNSFDFGMPTSQLMDVHYRGIDRSWMTKRAALLTKELSMLRPKEGHAYIHLISMGAQEAYGSNRNGDGFNEKSASFTFPHPKEGTPKTIKLAGGLMEYHPTFMKKGYVYRHHKNHDPKEAIGHIYAESYNPDMRRGELIIDVPITKRAQEEMGVLPHDWEAKIQKLASGKDIAFSMACKVAYDICSICGNRAPSRAQYCDHLTNHMSEIDKEGHQAFAINDAPGFFDISDVFRPADRIAYSLRKVAAAAAVGGAALAEEMGVEIPHGWLSVSSAAGQAKMALARKLADMEKQVDAVAQGAQNAHIKQLIPGTTSGKIPTQTMEVLKSVKTCEALDALTEAQILLSAADFLKLVTGEKTASVAGDIEMVESMLPGLYNRLLKSGEIEECVTETAYDPSYTAVPRRVKEAVLGLMRDHSMAPECVTKRAALATVRGEKPTLSTVTEKRAAVPASSSLLAKEYAKYQLSFVRATSGNSLTNGLTVLQNFK